MLTIIINLHGALTCCSPNRHGSWKPYAKETLKALYKSKLRVILINASFDALSNPHNDYTDFYKKLIFERKLDVKDTLILEHCALGAQLAHDSGAVCMVLSDNENKGCSLSCADYIIEGYEEADAQFFINAHHRVRGIPVTIGTTKRLIIRELSAADIPQLYKIYNSPYARKYVSSMSGTLDEELQKHLSYIKYQYGFYGYGYWGVFKKDTNVLLGSCGIETKEHDGRLINELGYIIDEKYKNNGYASEAAAFVIDYALNTLMFENVTALIADDNDASKKVIKKALGSLLKL